MRGRSDHDPSIAGTVSHPSAGQASPSLFRDTFCPAKHGILCIYYLSKTPFMRDFPQKVKVEDMKTKVLRETSLKKSKWKMWEGSFRARLPSKSESGKCENEAVVPDFPQRVKVEDVKTKLGCETSWLWDLLAVRSLGWDLLAARSLGWEISWPWDHLAVRSLGCGIPWLCGISWLWDLLAEISCLWDPLAVRSLGCEISWLRSLGCEISWLRDLLALRSLGCEISWLWDLVAEISSLRSLGCGKKK